MQPTVEQVRAEMRNVLARTGMSMRQLSLAMGRDVGYVAALLDSSRPSRAAPSPTALQHLSDSTGISLVYLLERFWGVSPQRLADDLSQLSIRFNEDERLGHLTDVELNEVLDFAGYLIRRRTGAGGAC